MEQTFLVTGIFILIVGAALGFLIEWIFRKENERDEEEIDSRRDGHAGC
jgi:hypothetical protein